MKNAINLFLPLLLFCCLISSCESTITTDNQESININQSALDALNDGEVDSAIQQFKDALKAGPVTNETQQIILRNIAITYYDNDQTDSATLYFTKAIDISPKETYEYYVNLADVDLLVDRIDEAIKNLKRARSIHPDRMEVNNTIGLIFIGEYGDKYIDYDRALTYNKKVQELSNDRTSNTVLARNYYYLGEYQKAEKTFSELNKKYPKLLDYQYWLGITKYDMGELDSAKIILVDLLKKDSTYNDVVMEYLE